LRTLRGCFDAVGGSFSYAYRSGAIDQAGNRALRAAFELQTPVVYFCTLARGQYWVVAPAFVTDDPAARMVALDAGLPVQDMQPGGLVSPPDLRAYATREARYRLHQQRFKLDVMRAYRHRCAICTLRERELVQAAHIVPDTETEGVAAVVNGIALCAIHHLAFDRNLLGIDPEGVVHIADRLLREIDGPMLRTGLQGFHGGSIAFLVAPRTGRTRIGSRCASSASRRPQPEVHRRSASRGYYGRRGRRVKDAGRAGSP
jgi:putative restriction endonuclease